MNYCTIVLVEEATAGVAFAVRDTPRESQLQSERKSVRPVADKVGIEQRSIVGHEGMQRLHTRTVVAEAEF